MFTLHPVLQWLHGCNHNEKINQKALYLFNVLGMKGIGIPTKLAKIPLKAWPCHWDATKKTPIFLMPSINGLPEAVWRRCLSFSINVVKGKTANNTRYGQAAKKSTMFITPAIHFVSIFSCSLISAITKQA